MARKIGETELASASSPERQAVSTTGHRRSRIHARLRRDTATLHHTVEGELRFLLEPSLSLELYRQVLVALYGFHAPMEALLARLRCVRPPLGLPLPRRTRLLEQDLRAVGSPSLLEHLPLCTDLPVSVRTEHVAGSLYVLEGASLGGQVISRALARSIGVGARHGASFFVGDGPRTFARWRRVLAWLEELVDGGGSEDEVVAGARCTFRALSRWLHEREIAR